MKATVRNIIKKVTLELIYEVVDERAKEIKDDIKTLYNRIESLNTRMDNLNGRMDQVKTGGKRRL